MAPPRTQAATVVWNPDPGDPAPDAKTSRLTAALTIQTLAGSLSAGARKEIQQIIGREIGEAAGAFGR